MFAPAVYTEIDTIAGYLDVQLEGMRESAYGLTEEAARARPCRSELSIGGLLKHVTWVMRGRLTRSGVPDAEDFAARIAEFMDSFALRSDESLVGTLAAFDEARVAFLESVRRTDPDAAVIEPPAPWDNRPEPTPTTQRFQLLHLLEELARHAGHADIIREQLDGATAMPLHFAAEGLPGNAFVQPWAPTSTP